MGLKKADLADLSLAEWADTVAAWNGAQGEEQVVLNDDETDELSAWIDRVEAVGHA